MLPGGIAVGAAFMVAALFLSSSSSLHLVVRISIVSARSFLSVASLANSSRQASRSTFRFSFSNSSGVSAKVFFDFFICYFSELVLVLCLAVGLLVARVLAGIMLLRTEKQMKR